MTTFYFRNEIIYEFCYNRMVSECDAVKTNNGNGSDTAKREKKKKTHTRNNNRIGVK